MKTIHTLFLLTSLVFFIAINSSKAQSDNLCPLTSVPILQVNPCTGAAPYSIPQSYNVDNSANVSNNTACVSFSNNKRDGWYQFIATSPSTSIIATLNANNRNVALALYTGVCGSMTEISCINSVGNGATETLTSTTVPGTTYFLRIIRISSGTTNNSMDGAIEVVSPAANNNCSGAINLTPSVQNGICAPICATTYGTTASTPPTGCSGTANDDVWFSFTATQISHLITVTAPPKFDAVIEMLSGPCGAMTSLGCANNPNSGGTENLTANNLIIGNVYYIRVYDYGSGIPGSFEFNICITSPPPPTCPTGLGVGVVNVSSLPYSSTGRTTVGRGNELTANNVVVCGNSNYYQGPDEVFIFTPTTSGNISVSLTSGGSNVGIMLYNGCPFIGQGGTCVENSQSTSGNQFFCANVIAGNTYYLVVDGNSTTGISNYALSITSPTTTLLPGSICGNAITANLPFTALSQSTLCKGNDYTNASIGSCGSLYESGEDMVYSLTVSFPQCISVVLSNTSSAQTGFMVYQNCPGTAGANCLGFIGGGNVSGNFSLPAPGTYYIIVDSWEPPSGVSYDINITSAAGSIVNDLPCNATSLPLNTNVNGDNSCSNGALEPTAPTCWTTGALNTVWYTVVPSSSTLIIKTFLGTLANTQIALYTGSCNSLTQVAPTSSSCNQDISCGSNTLFNSQLTVSGLTPGQTYYVRVDGEDDRTGTFGILAVDGTTGLPFVYGQDCTLPLPICQNTISVANPGFTAFGNYCDFGSGLNCLLSGERSGSWYTIPIGINGNLEFDIIPNDWLGAPSTTSTDYDFAIWEVGISGLQCSQLPSTTPLRCNYSSLGVTGLSGTGNSPGSYPGFNASYEPAIAATVGQVYLLFVSNYTNSTSGFTMNFTGSPDPVNYAVVPSSMTWLGGTNTTWGVSANWGACAPPNCSADAIIGTTSINQPVVTADQTVNNITINPGASLTINSNVTLSVCGDFTNNGTLITFPGSTVKFVGSGLQQISGSLAGTNSFANFSMQKPSGTLLINSNIQIKENDSLTTGFFDSNSKDIFIGNNFYILNGTNTHNSPIVAGKYEFNGSTNQTFTNAGLSNVVFNNVSINQTTNVALVLGGGSLNDLYVGGTLNLAKGKIVTGYKQVYVVNAANSAVTIGNSTSYVEGNLRRVLNNNATGIYEFPVGNSAKGYQRAEINFTTATQIPELYSYFTSWPSVPNGPVSSECVYANYSLNPALNNGFWTFNSLANNSTGNYDITLFNTNYTNIASPGGWTAMKRDPASTGSWGLDGNCVLTSTVNGSQRSGMLGFNSDFATAQSNFPLPIELINFEAKIVKETVQTWWITATEINNDFFTLERGTDGVYFTAIGKIKGAGNSTQENYYSFTDVSPGKGIIYYRLKQIDFDGKFSYSQVIAVKMNPTINELSIFPNPAQEILNYQFESIGGNMTIKILDITGKVRKEEIKYFKQGPISSTISINDISDGVYYLVLTNQESSVKAWFIHKE